MTEPRRGEEALARLIAEHRGALDAEVARSGALPRVRDNVLMRSSYDPLQGLSWRRVAAAVLVAGMLGGAIDLVLPERAPDTADVAIVGVLEDFDQLGLP
ncbi:MAG: hypothetical protein ACRED5_15100 [Propylenella sp.]